MINFNFELKDTKIPQYNYLFFLVKWLLIAGFISLFIGSVVAFFLLSLESVTDFRESNVWIIWLLPIAGLIIGLSYHYFGTSVVQGNNLLLEEFHNPKQIIPLKMAPLVLFGTLLTHLCGGSAGREGTAVQIGGAISDQFTRIFKLRATERKLLIIIGISGGFAAVFGTPIAGAIFAIEMMLVGRMRYETLLPSLIAAVFSNYICLLWGVHHTVYTIDMVPIMDAENLLITIFAGILFGLTAMWFSKSIHFVAHFSARFISFPPLRPFIGGIFIALFVFFMGSTKFIGLGIPTIQEAFTISLPASDFVIKLLITAFTLGVGFKGGEVTPLFFVGATLGSALFMFLPLPVALLAGMGFVAVFAGATNTPIACTFMGIELFGAESAAYIAVACFVAYLFSGHTGIYTSQIIGSSKHFLYAKLVGKRLSDL